MDQVVPPVEPNQSQDPLSIERWPALRVGDAVEIAGAPFEVQRLNASTVVLRPVTPPDYSARQVLDEMRRREA